MFLSCDSYTGTIPSAAILTGQSGLRAVGISLNFGHSVDSRGFNLSLVIPPMWASSVASSTPTSGADYHYSLERILSF